MFKFLRRNFKNAERENIRKGREGEDIACAYLKRKGYRIIERNFRASVGEIDIIARDDKYTVFVEVKMRVSDDFAKPEENVDYSKQQKIKRCAELYLLQNGLYDTDCRFDVVSIKSNGKEEKIELIRNAFSI
ncbi:MAG: YraN family protein [Candidatus Schekmanbacteria bacterium]|nr:MAG: YraN family protein [Candidatus Schekmanbacteria bacterium]